MVIKVPAKAKKNRCALEPLAYKPFLKLDKYTHKTNMCFSSLIIFKFYYDSYLIAHLTLCTCKTEQMFFVLCEERRTGQETTAVTVNLEV